MIVVRKDARTGSETFALALSRRGFFFPVWGSDRSVAADFASEIAEDAVRRLVSLERKECFSFRTDVK